MAELAFILTAVNDEALTETLRPAIAGVSGISTLELDDALRIQLADLIATAEVVDGFGDVLLLVHYEGVVDENAVSLAVHAHNPATPSTRQAQHEAWTQVAEAADAALEAIDFDDHLQDIEDGRAVAALILADTNLPAATRNRIGGLFNGILDKLELQTRFNRRLLQTFAKTNDTTINGV